MDYLCGEGTFEKAADQATMPASVLTDIKSVAQRVLMLTSSKTTSFTQLSSIKQAPIEPFLTFYDHLKEAVTRQIEDVGTQKGTLKTLAVENANEKCQAVLRTLPLDQPPTIEQMVEVCNRAGTVRGFRGQGGEEQNDWGSGLKTHCHKLQ